MVIFHCYVSLPEGIHMQNIAKSHNKFFGLPDANFRAVASAGCPSHISRDVHDRPHQAVVQGWRLRRKEDQQGIIDFVETRMGQLSVDVVVIAPLVEPQQRNAKRMQNRCQPPKLCAEFETKSRGYTVTMECGPAQVWVYCNCMQS